MAEPTQALARLRTLLSTDNDGLISSRSLGAEHVAAYAFAAWVLSHPKESSYGAPGSPLSDDYQVGASATLRWRAGGQYTPGKWGPDGSQGSPIALLCRARKLRFDVIAGLTAADAATLGVRSQRGACARVRVRARPPSSRGPPRPQTPRRAAPQWGCRAVSDAGEGQLCDGDVEIVLYASPRGALGQAGTGAALAPPYMEAHYSYASCSKVGAYRASLWGKVSGPGPGDCQLPLRNAR
jgi:hypothetical protein